MIEFMKLENENIEILTIDYGLSERLEAFQNQIAS